MSEDKYARMKMPCAEVGRALACSDDEDQAAVLNSFAEELRIVCRDESLTSMQVCYMARGLNGNGRKLVVSLAEFVRLDEEAAAAR